MYACTTKKGEEIVKVEEVDIESVKLYENNARYNEDGVDVVANSIAEFGFKQPIVVDENNVIIVGHTRLKAAKKLELACCSSGRCSWLNYLNV